MKGLLLKDFYTLIKQMKLFLAFIVIFSLLPGYNMAAFAIMYASFLPMTALAYDERSKWDTLAAMMPYTPRQMVLSKYLLGYITTGAAALLAFVVQTFTAVIKKEPLSAEGWLSLAMVLCVAVIMQAVVMPIMFKMGVEKGRMVFFAVVAVIVLGGMALGDNLVAVLEDASTASLSTVCLIAVGAAVIINLISIAISAKMYRLRKI
ncbi:MAG: ABC-2 transporter permease [Clostridiales bacterium]|nr:ABC-2 transporter permease [Clostridiales bacterium]